MTGQFGLAPWQAETERREVSRSEMLILLTIIFRPQNDFLRSGRQLDSTTSRVWPDARVPYEFEDTIDYQARSINIIKVTLRGYFLECLKNS